MNPEKSAKVIVGRLEMAEGPNRTHGTGTASLMKEREPEKKSEMSEVDLRVGGRKPPEAQFNGSNLSGNEAQPDPRQPDLVEKMLERGNLLSALQAVERNQGAAGVDGMEVAQLRAYLREHWGRIREQILKGEYEPRPVRRVDIPKPGGGTRMLGIPTVLDRLLQQAIQQILTPLWEPEFSAHSYGFRPGRSAQQAVKAAQGHVNGGKRWVVDMDLEKFFDRVNHDVMMARLERKIKDERVLGLIRGYLESGIMRQGIVRVAPESVKRFKDKLRTKFRAGRGRNLKRFLTEDLQPFLRGWASYFSVAETRRVFEDLDEWVRRKLRCMEWRKWKRGRTRYRKLLGLGFTKEKARVCAFNGRGPWWNAGSQHMNAALPTSYFRRLGLVLLIEVVDWLTALRAARAL